MSLYPQRSSQQEKDKSNTPHPHIYKLPLQRGIYVPKSVLFIDATELAETPLVAIDPGAIKHLQCVVAKVESHKECWQLRHSFAHQRRYATASRETKHVATVTSTQQSQLISALLNDATSYRHSTDSHRRQLYNATLADLTVTPGEAEGCAEQRSRQVASTQRNQAHFYHLLLRHISALFPHKATIPLVCLGNGSGNNGFRVHGKRTTASFWTLVKRLTERGLIVTDVDEFFTSKVKKEKKKRMANALKKKFYTGLSLL